MHHIRSLFRDVSVSAIVAGFVVTLVSYSSSLVFVLEAARAADLDSARTASWVWAISIGSGVCGIALTLLTRTPVIVAWSTPGAALLIASIGGFSFGEAVGAFIVASAAATVAGATGAFGWLLDRFPAPILQALLAGVLLPFIIDAAQWFETSPLIAGSVVVVFFIAKRFIERYAVLAALAVGLFFASIEGSFSNLRTDTLFTVPVLTMPEFTTSALLTIALPLFIVTMASQNAPGLAVMRLNGFAPNGRLLVGTISAVSTLLAPFGNHALNLSAISAAIAAGPESHAIRRRRYIAGLSCGVGYLVVGTFSGFLTAAFQSIPVAAIAALAAVALLGSTLAAIRGALMADASTGVAALVTLAVTMSGVELLGVGSTVWGLVAGAFVVFSLRRA